MAKVVVVKLGLETMVVMTDFHSTVLYATGPMPITLDVLRIRLSRVGGTQLACDHAHNPMVLAVLKQCQALGPKVARTKLVALDTMEAALIAAGKRPDHVALIMQTYKQVANHSSSEGMTTAPSVMVQPPASTTSLGPIMRSPSSPQVPCPPAEGLVAGGHAPMSHPSDTMASELLAAIGNALAKRQAPQEPSPELGGVWTRDWPTKLPELAFPPTTLKDDYSLATILPKFREHQDIPLVEELRAFKEWCTTPVNLARGQEYPNHVASITYQGNEDNILGFTGFMFKVCHH